MEPIKFEDNIREKLQEREISQSKTAWKKLETQLDAIPKKRTKKSVWFAIAAGFISVLIIASFIFNNDVIPSQNTQKIVSEPLQKEVVSPLENDSEIIVAEEVFNKDKTEKIIKKKPITNSNELSFNEDEKVFPKTNESTLDTVAVTTIENIETLQTKDVNKEEDFINTKVAEVVAQLQAIQEEGDSVSSEEIDALLLNAQKEIEVQKIINKQKVDATALLNVVETELETSFRDKVFEALGNGYEKVRTAVVERNN